MSLPEKIDLPLPGGVSLSVRRIVDIEDVDKGAEFSMGARSHMIREEPVHRVRFGAPFYFGETPVTQSQYQAMAEACLDGLAKLNGNQGADPSRFKGDDRPVEQVDWRDAETVCKWLSGSSALSRAVADAGLTGTWRAGLPNEAQWEVACRAGTVTDYWNGDGEAALAEFGWFDKSSEEGTRPTGENLANSFGLQDLHGNVWEWCAPHAYAKREDGWIARTWTDADAGKDASSQFSNDGSSHRVLRGGSWFDTAGDCRFAFRNGGGAGCRSGRRGLRVCLFPGPVADATTAGEAGGRAEASPERSIVFVS